MRQRLPVSVKAVDTLEGFGALRDEWNRLLSESRADNFFLRWEWLFEWWKAYREDRCQLFILLAYRGASLIGIAPFYIMHPGTRSISGPRLMFLGTKEGCIISEYMDIIFREADAKDAIRAMLEYVDRNRACDEICLQLINASSQTPFLVEQASREMNYMHVVSSRNESPYIELKEGYGDFIESLSASMRHKIRNSVSRLSRYECASFRTTASAPEFEADFKEFVRLHQLRWEHRKYPGAFASATFKAFQKSIMLRMLQDGRLNLTFFSVRGRNIAAIYNIAYNRKIIFYLSGLDATFEPNLTPGLLLHNFSIEKACKAGFEEYNLLIMGNLDGYKKRWASKSHSLVDLRIIRPVSKKIMVLAGMNLRRHMRALRRLME